MDISDALRRKVYAYHPAASASETLESANILLLVGISGAGKNAVLAQLLSLYPDTYSHILSYTTRRPRANKGVHEQDGVDYHFVDLRQAEALIEAQAFIEVKEYAHNLYGTGLADFVTAQKAGKIAVTDIEMKGAEEFVALAPSIRPVFIVPPSYEVWQRRMRQRYGEALHKGADNWAARVATARFELQLALEKDHFVPVINDELDRTVALIHRFAQHGEVPPATDAKAIMRDILAHL